MSGGISSHWQVLDVVKKLFKDRLHDQLLLGNCLPTPAGAIRHTWSTAWAVGYVRWEWCLSRIYCRGVQKVLRGRKFMKKILHLVINVLAA